MKKTNNIPHVLTVLLIIITAFSACGEKGPTPTVETIDGVEHILNLETPLQPEKTVEFEQELAIAEEDAEGNIILYRPGQIAVDPQDNIYISDQQDMTIKVFSPEGELIRTIGRKGEGPGEFQGISAMAFFPDGGMLVQDWRARRTSLFDQEGNFQSSFKWKNSHLTLFWITENSLTTDERIFGEETQLFIKTFDPTGEELHNLGEFNPEKPKILQQGNMGFAMSVPYTPHSVLCADPVNRLLYHCHNDTYQIEVYDEAGTLLRILERPYSPVPYTGEEQNEFRERYQKQPDSPFTKMVNDMELPSVKTITGRMLVDEQGNLWVETYEIEEVEGKTFIAFDIFNPQGFYEAKIWSDIRPMIFRSGKMYNLSADEESGFLTVKRYRVIWGENE